LSNLLFKDVDDALADLAAEHSIRYSRYADDIVFSGTRPFPDGVRERTKAIVESGGWRLSGDKEFFAEKPNRLKVFGLLVDGEVPRLTKGYRNRIRAYRHLIDNHRVAPDDMPRLLGHLAYARSVDNQGEETG